MLLSRTGSSLSLDSRPHFQMSRDDSGPRHDLEPMPQQRQNRLQALCCAAFAAGQVHDERCCPAFPPRRAKATHRHCAPRPSRASLPPVPALRGRSRAASLPACGRADPGRSPTVSTSAASCQQILREPPQSRLHRRASRAVRISACGHSRVSRLPPPPGLRCRSSAPASSDPRW